MIHAFDLLFSAQQTEDDSNMKVWFQNHPPCAHFYRSYDVPTSFVYLDYLWHILYYILVQTFLYRKNHSFYKGGWANDGYQALNPSFVKSRVRL
jgi:hypothetical protein